jgi:hypothetical protein
MPDALFVSSMISDNVLQIKEVAEGNFGEGSARPGVGTQFMYLSSHSLFFWLYRFIGDFLLFLSQSRKTRSPISVCYMKRGYALTWRIVSLF